MKRLWISFALAALQGASQAGNSLDELLRDYDRVRPAAVATPLPATAVTPATEPDAWARLLAGNDRFVKGQSQHPHQGYKRRLALAKVQAPSAIILACSDSRVAPELIFDQGLGDLFVVRVSGNVASPADRANIEHAVEQFHSHLLVVVGHSRCDAALEDAKRSLQRLLEQSSLLQKAVKSGELKALSARYDLDSGRVEPLD